MGKGPAHHMKRELSPSFWPIHRKRHVWAVKTSPGPQPANQSLPLVVVVRDLLGHAETGREAKMLIKQGKILVDGTPRRDEGVPIGVMDVLEIPDAKETFRVLPARGGRLKLHPIRGDEKGFKLCRITGKTSLKGGKTQLNLHDGRNILSPEGEEPHDVGDVLRLKIPEQEMVDSVKFETGALAIVTGGRSKGTLGSLAEIGSEPGDKRIVALRTREGEEVRTLARYVFVVGRGEPLVSLAGGS